MYILYITYNFYGHKTTLTTKMFLLKQFGILASSFSCKMHLVFEVYNSTFHSKFKVRGGKKIILILFIFSKKMGLKFGLDSRYPALCFYHQSCCFPGYICFSRVRFKFGFLRIWLSLLLFCMVLQVLLQIVICALCEVVQSSFQDYLSTEILHINF